MSVESELTRKSTRISLVSTRRTDVLCIACGNFGAERVVVRLDDSETDMGVHDKCAPEIER